LVRQSPDSIDLFEASLATARSADAAEGPLVEHLRQFCQNWLGSNVSFWRRKPDVHTQNLVVISKG